MVNEKIKAHKQTLMSLSCSSLWSQHSVWICQHLVYFSIHRAVILNGHRWNYCLIILGTEWEGWASSPSVIKVSIFEHSSPGRGYSCCRALLSSHDGGMQTVFAHCCHNLHSASAVLGAPRHPTTLWPPALWNTTYLQRQHGAGTFSCLQLGFCLARKWQHKQQQQRNP